jgi:hypothetical protein
MTLHHQRCAEPPLYGSCHQRLRNVMPVPLNNIERCNDHTTQCLPTGGCAAGDGALPLTAELTGAALVLALAEESVRLLLRRLK